MIKYYLYINCNPLSDNIMVFLNGILQSPGIDYIFEQEENIPAFCGGCYIIFKNGLKTLNSNLCVVLNSIDFWYKITHEGQIIDQSKDTTGFDERYTKWL